MDIKKFGPKLDELDELEQLHQAESMFKSEKKPSVDLYKPLLIMTFDEIEELFARHLKKYNDAEMSFGVGTHHILMVNREGCLITIIFNPTLKKYYIKKKLPDHMIIDRIEEDHAGLQLTLNGYPTIDLSREKVVKLF